MRVLPVLLSAAFFLSVVGCNHHSQEGLTPEEAPKAAGDVKPYVPPEGTFAIKAPLLPEARGVGTSQQYTFYGLDTTAAGPLLTIQVSPKIPEGAAGLAGMEIPPERYEQGYRAEPGAVVNSQPLSMGSYTGRELDITAGRRAPLRIRIYNANGRQYWLEWNPTIAHSTEVADTFVIP